MTALLLSPHGHCLGTILVWALKATYSVYADMLFILAVVATSSLSSHLKPHL